MLKRAAFLLALLMLPTRPVMAHDGEPHGTLGWWGAWSLEPAVFLLLGLTLGLYVRGYRSLVQRTGRPSRQLKLRTWAFAVGMFTLAVALLSPIDALGEQLFWVHMVQHNLLMLVAAPLLVYSYPLSPMLLGLPAGVRTAIGQGWGRSGWLRRLWGMVSSPLVAWMLLAFALWSWHAPLLYQASVENELVHVFQHFSFLGTSLLFWWVVLHTFGARAAYRGAGVIYLFTTALHSGLLGALLTFSTRVLYPIYTERTEQWGLTALADQQLAGTIMWVPGGLVYLFAALWLMKTWLDAFETGEETVLRKDKVE